MKSTARRRLHTVFRALDLVRRFFLTALFFLLIIGLIIVVISARPPRVKRGSILVVNPYGTLVDAYTAPVSYLGLPIGGYLAETLLSDLISSLDAASADDRVAGVWLRLDDLGAAGSASAGELADAVDRFSLSGKPVLASADSYDTSRYRIASAADRVVVDRLGEVFPAGYGLWRAYFAEGLEKIGVETHLFRSGESKSAGENFLFSGMSETARSDEERLLGDLWTQWLREVSRNRDIPQDVLNRWIDRYDDNIIAAGGDGSKSAKIAGLVDGVETGGVVEGYLTDLFGPGAPQINALDYVRRAGRKNRSTKGTVAVVPIVGSLVYGEGGAGYAGSDDVVSAVATARNRPDVRALVLRIDSPGGEVRAGEAIRRIVEETRTEWNMPVVTSMGNLAASGGYWIALESDYILTRPETVTGSIGVYSLTLDFQKGLEEILGIRIDGLGTTPWSGSGHPGRTLDERTASLYRASVEDIDGLFKKLVMEKRGINPDDIDRIAGGIPWSGIRAVSLGLADEVGGLDDARRKAAEMAGMDNWGWRTFERVRNPREVLIGRILWGHSALRRSAERFR